MHDRCSARAPRTRLRTAALLPVAVVAWLTLGSGSAMAAPSAHAAAAATTAGQPATSNAGGNGNGQANGADNGKGNGKAVDTTLVAGTTSSASMGSGSADSGGSDHNSGNAGTSGDPSQPQPLSNADQNSGGANGKCPGGPYCSTRDGSPSGNGNGNGKATGKPCAGCVGKADNKNPKGQYPNGSDNNAGYECDRNHGIGRTNPAHTGCTTSTPPPCDSTTEDCGGGGGCDASTQDCGGGGGCDASTQDCGGGDCGTDTSASNDDCTPGCPDGQVMGDDGECTTPGCPAGEVMNDSGDCTPTPDCVPTAANDFCSTVEGEHHSRNPKPSTKPTTHVLGEKVTRTPSALPFTGAEGIGLMLGTAAMALTVGGGLMIAARRRRGELG
jgi:hypothetical protein